MFLEKVIQNTTENVLRDSTNATAHVALDTREELSRAGTACTSVRQRGSGPVENCSSKFRLECKDCHPVKVCFVDAY